MPGGEPAQRRLPDDHPPVKSGRVGVLLLNLGTPDGTGYWPMRRYLKQFLSDRRVIEEPRTWEYGERSGVVEDLGGHRWELTQTLRDVAPEEWGGTTVAPW